MNYFDTSALIKLFVTEAGSPVVQALAAGESSVATSKVTYVEVHAALARKRREGYLADSKYALVTRQFDRDWLGYFKVDVKDEILLAARDLVRRYPLRGYDAVHLASALSLKNALGEGFAFAAADERLLRASRAEGLRAIDVEAAAGPPGGK